MFDIGALEILVIAVVALLIVGPEEFPYLLRSFGRTLGKVKRVVASVKDQFEEELEKTEQIKKKMQEELTLADLHKDIEAGVEGVSSGLRQSVSINPSPQPTPATKDSASKPLSSEVKKASISSADAGLPSKTPKP